MAHKSVQELKEQCKADGVSDDHADAHLNNREISAYEGLLTAWVEHTVGGTIDLAGQEDRKELRHRNLLGRRLWKGSARHASMDRVPEDCPHR